MEKVKDFLLDLLLNKGVTVLWGLFIVFIGYIAVKVLLNKQSCVAKITLYFLTLSSVKTCKSFALAEKDNTSRFE